MGGESRVDSVVLDTDLLGRLVAGDARVRVSPLGAGCSRKHPLLGRLGHEQAVVAVAVVVVIGNRVRSRRGRGGGGSDVDRDHALAVPVLLVLQLLLLPDGEAGSYGFFVL